MVQPIDKRFQVSEFLVLYLITAVQIGVGILGFQTSLLEAKSDGWIAIIVAGGMIQIVIFLLYKLLQNSNGDLIDIHQQAFGKWIGNFFSIAVMIYFIATTITVMRTYIEVVQVSIFPQLTTWSLTLVFIVLTYYIVISGFRTVTGICFFSVVLPAYLLLTFLFPIEFAEWDNILPFFETGIGPIFNASLNMTLSYLGFSTLLVYYPYIKNGRKSQKWAHIGTLITTFVYVFIEIMSIIFYSQEQLRELNWPTIGLWKIFEMPFVERFEYIGISTWFIIIIPNIALMTWAASRIGKRVFGYKQKYFLVICLVIIFVGSFFFESREEINFLNNIVSGFGKYYNFIYIPILFAIHYFVQKVRKKYEKNNSCSDINRH